MLPLERLDAAVQRIREHVGSRDPRGVSHDDADDVVGTIDCDDAIGFDPLQLLSALDRHGARAVVIGQVAGIMHGSQELTGDLDLLWSGDAGEAAAFADAFTEIDALLFDDDNQSLFRDSAAFALPKVLFRSASASGDCCTPFLPSGTLDITGTLDRAETARAGGFSVHYAALPDLIIMREASGRPKDLRRAAELAALSRTTG
jgi:hypothetical protein